MRANLRTNPVPVSFLVIAMLTTVACYDDSAYDTVGQDNAERLSLQAVDYVAPLTADGFSTINIQATIDRPDGSKHQVVFTQTGEGDYGTFVGGKDESGIISAESNVLGVASIFFKSDTKSGEVGIKAAITGTTIESDVLTISLAEPQVDDYLSFVSVDPPSPMADNESYSVVSLHVQMLPEDLRLVTLKLSTSDLQVSPSDGAKPDQDGIVEFRVKSPSSAGPETITAMVNGLKLTTVIDYVAALPDYASLSVASPLENDGESTSTPVTLTLFRAQGEPSIGLAATFTAEDSLGNPVGVFRNQTLSHSEGINVIIKADYFPDPDGTLFTGPVKITGIVNDITSVSGQYVMMINNDAALPDSLPDYASLSVASALENDGAVTSTPVTLTLFRVQGEPSVGLAATFTAEDSLGNPVGVFRNQTLSHSEGNNVIIKADYFPDPDGTLFTGPIKITGIVNDITSVIGEDVMIINNDI